MSADTLTDAQAEVLRAVDADRAWMTTHVNPTPRSEAFPPAFSGRAARNCVRKGWVAATPERRLNKYGYAMPRAVLTAAGREALAAHEAGDRRG